MLVGQGGTQTDTICSIGLPGQTHCRWRKAHGDMGTEHLRELPPQKENERLRRAVSDLTLDKLILAEAAK